MKKVFLALLLTACGCNNSSIDQVDPYLGQSITDYQHRQLIEANASYEKYFVHVEHVDRHCFIVRGPQPYWLTVENGKITSIWTLP